MASSLAMPLPAATIGPPFMDETRFATWKYNHPGAGYRTPGRLVGIAVAAVAAITGLAVFLPIGIFLAALALALAFSTSKKILVGPRYAICGPSLVYYNNVVDMSLDETAGTLRLVSANQQAFVLERDKFPTNARKKDKITRNKAEKFAKVSRNLIGKVLRASPNVRTSGVPHGVTSDE